MLAVLGAGAGCAQKGAGPVEKEVVPASENAAMRFWEAHYQLSSRQLYFRHFDYEFDEITQEEWYTYLEKAQDAIRYLIEATKVPRCDFGVPEEWTLDEQRWHLPAAREMVIFLWEDAERLSGLNQFSAVEQRLSSVVRLSAHLAHNAGTPIESLASLSFLSRAAQECAKQAEDFSAEDRANIAAAIDRFDATDPFNFARTLRASGDLSHRWWLKLRNSEEFGPPDLEDIKRKFGYDLEDRLLELQSYEAQVDELDWEFEAQRQFWHQVSAAFVQPDAEQQLARIAEDAENMKYGIIASTWNAMFYWSTNQWGVQHLDGLRAWATGETETLELPAD
ncbi:MAG: hypothetical protein ACNA8P_05475 [Phycisphaerales bacterium]